MNTVDTTWTVATHSVEETIALGAALGRALAGGETIGLVGPLGSGKTQFVKGIAAGNTDNVAATATRVISPTFTLIHEYPGRLRLYHIDVYRLDGPAQLLALGFEELIHPGSAVVVEWADRVEDILPAGLLHIEIEPTGESSRRFTCAASGPAARQCLTAMQAAGR